MPDQFTAMKRWVKNALPDDLLFFFYPPPEGAVTRRQFDELAALVVSGAPIDVPPDPDMPPQTPHDDPTEDPPPPAGDPVEAMMVNSSNGLRIRSGPSVTSPKLGDPLPDKTLVDVSGSVPGGDYHWAKLIRVNGLKFTEIGFVAREFLTPAVHGA